MKRLLSKENKYLWLGEIPSDWKVYPLNSITNTISIKNHPDEEILSLYRDYGVIIKSSRSDNHNRPGSDLTKYKLVSIGNLVINKMKAWQGSVGISKFKGIISPAYIICQVDSGINSNYLNYLLRCNYYKHQYGRLSYGVRTDQWDIRYDDFKKLPVLIPHEKEQITIVKYLDYKTEKINRFIKKKKQLIKLLKERKSATINQAVTKGLDLNVPMKDSGIEWLGYIPEHWENWKLSRAYKYFGSGTTPKSGSKIYYENGNIPWVNTGDLNNSILETSENKITQEALDDHSVLKIYPKGTISVAMYGASIGKISIINFEFTSNQACCNVWCFNWQN